MHNAPCNIPENVGRAGIAVLLLPLHSVLAAGFACGAIGSQGHYHKQALKIWFVILPSHVEGRASTHACMDCRQNNVKARRDNLKLGRWPTAVPYVHQNCQDISAFESAPRAPHSGTQIANAVSAKGFEVLGSRAQRGVPIVADTAAICHCREPETAPAAAAAAQRWLASTYTCHCMCSCGCCCDCCACRATFTMAAVDDLIFYVSMSVIAASRVAQLNAEATASEIDLDDFLANIDGDFVEFRASLGAVGVLQDEKDA
jgi:hypothetical protein